MMKRDGKPVQHMITSLDLFPLVLDGEVSGDILIPRWQ